MSDVPISALLEEARAYYKALLRPVFEGRGFVLPGNIAVGLGNVALELRGLGAARPFVVAGSHGTGPLPPREDAELRVLDVRGTDPLEHNRNVQRALADLPSAVQDAVDAWDPEGAARTLHTDPLAEPRPVAGRSAYAARPREWIDLEDKVVIDAFWDTVGVPRAPAQVVPAEHEALRTAASALDRGHGTVWAPDAREGANAGAVALRWVRPGDDGRQAAADLARIADSVRVMPFLEGIPASIHGVVFPDAVVVFRPVEMLVLRPASGSTTGRSSLSAPSSRPRTPTASAAAAGRRNGRSPTPARSSWCAMAMTTARLSPGKTPKPHSCSDPARSAGSCASPWIPPPTSPGHPRHRRPPEPSVWRIACSARSSANWRRRGT